MQTFQNTFEGARNTDTAHSRIEPNQYVEAHNIELVGDGSFLSVRNVAGTTQVRQIIGSSTAESLCNPVPTKYTIGGTLYNCLTLFTATPSGLFKIWCHNLQTNDLYELYEETIGADYLTSSGMADPKLYPEGGVDYLYFTDNYFEPRFIKCEIPSPYSANFLSSYDISLLRKGANGIIRLNDVSGTSNSPDGTLLSGTYQFAYRMCDPENKRFTKWSSLTNPIHVYSRGNTTSSSSSTYGDPVYSGIGMTTPRAITLTITPSPAEIDFFDYIQLAVLENVSITEPISASLLEITEITSTSLSFEYKSNSKIGTIPISDITTPLAPIDTVKTLNIKENRLWGANVTYTSLDFDNGTPSVTSGSISVTTTSASDPYSSDDIASISVGYWRDEVYRFGIVYYDEDGNASPVHPLDLTSKITGNQIGNLPDVKFPSRATSNSYTLMDSDNKIRILGLQLDNITNHPTWARSFEIVRVRRKKDILFQSPFIPMVTIQGVGAVDKYPTIYWNGTEDVTVSDAQPQTSGTVLIPKNLFWPEMRNVIRHTTQDGEDRLTTKIGEVKYDVVRRSDFGMIFPSGSMYTPDGTTPVSSFVFTGSEKIDVVDYALLKLNITDDSPEKNGSDIDVGDDLNTNVSGNFYSLIDGDYYFDAAWGGKSIFSSEKGLAIIDYEFFSNFGQPASVGGYSTLDYESLQTRGVTLGFQPNVLKCAVVKLSHSVPDPNNSSKIFKNAILNTYSSGDYVTSQNSIRYQDDRTNLYVTNYSSFNDDSTYIGAVNIVNVRLGLGNDRYGDINAFHEYISTGAKYTFSESEVSTLELGGSVSVNITVHGGDCFVGPQTFKVCDSTYSVINQPKNNGESQTDSELLTKWGIFYDNNASAPMCIPVAVENASQFIQVLVESDFSEVRDIDNVVRARETVGMCVYNVDTKEAMRTPMSYRYNLNLLKQNDNRVYLPKPTYSFEQNNFPARLIYSDPKIYNSDQAGFDIIRVGNTVDLEESRRGITKLAVAGDNLYAIQEQGVTYIPTGERQIEQTTGGALSVRSGDVVGRPLTIDSVRGSQHLRGIVETGSVVYIPDNLNKSVYVLAGQELKPIIQNNETQFRSFFGNLLDGNAVIGLYDFNRKEYWLYKSGQCEVFNEERGWVGTYDFTGFQGGVSTNQKLYLIGRPSSSQDVYTMYDGTVNQLFGVGVEPSISFIVNPNGNTSKTFDNIMIAASSALSTADFTTEGVVSQTVTGTSVDINPREGNYRLATPRDSSNARLRGLRMKITTKFKAVQTTLNSIATKYRLSFRTPW